MRLKHFSLFFTAVFVVVSFDWAVANARSAPESFADLADKLSPAVVNISTTYSRSRNRDGQVGPGNVPWEEWFRDYFQRNRSPLDNDRPLRRRNASLGSGFIIDKSGYIVTNNHVIENADQVSVVLADDTVLPATIVGRDERIDIALLKVEPETELPALTWGDSNASRVGDWVVAIGNPFGFSGSVTAGIISARARNIRASNYGDFIQTDAAINRGNSGGPLFNMAGEVIGINTAIFSPSGGSVGVGFAASSNLVRPIINDLREFGRTRRGWIGVQFQSVSEEIALSLGLDRARGALVSQVIQGGPAADAGIYPSDIILSFDGKPINKMEELPKVVAQATIQSLVDVEVWHEGQSKTVQIKVSELDPVDESEIASLGNSGPTTRERPEEVELATLGVTVVEISDEIREGLALPPTMRGLMVIDVDDFSDAALKGMRKGDVIDEIQQMTVVNVVDARVALQKAVDTEKRVVLVRVTTNGAIRYIPVKVSS